MYSIDIHCGLCYDKLVASFCSHLGVRVENERSSLPRKLGAPRRTRHDPPCRALLFLHIETKRQHGFPHNTVGTELTLAEYTYAPNGGNLQKMTYGNGDFVEYTHNMLDKGIEEVYYNSSRERDTL